MKSGLDLINEERARQIAAGFTHEHDDSHVRGELALAALSYLCAALRPCLCQPISWPWDPGAWRPEGGPERCMAKAGALYLAEGERCLRAGNHAEAEKYGRYAAECAAWLQGGFLVEPVACAIRGFGGRLQGVMES